MSGKRRAVPLERDDGLRVAIEIAGGEGPLARAVGITVQALREWKTTPAHRVAKIEALTGIPRERLRPDLFGVGTPNDFVGTPNGGKVPNEKQSQEAFAHGFALGREQGRKDRNAEVARLRKIIRHMQQIAKDGLRET